MASSTTVEPNGSCVWKMAKSFGALWLLEKVKLTMLLAISVKLFGAKPTAKPSPTSNPQPGTGVAVGVGLAVGVGVGVGVGGGTQEVPRNRSYSTGLWSSPPPFTRALSPFVTTTTSASPGRSSSEA